MPGFTPDTSCIVPALSAWHDQHAPATRAMNAWLQTEPLRVAAHTIAETYSVLTRLPPPFRLSPHDAWMTVQRAILDRAASITALEAAPLLACIEQSAAQGVAGGAVYDSLIIACAEAAGAETILTFNERQFRLLAPASIRIVVPQ